MLLLDILRYILYTLAFVNPHFHIHRGSITKQSPKHNTNINFSMLSEWYHGGTRALIYRRISAAYI